MIAKFSGLLDIRDPNFLQSAVTILEDLGWITGPEDLVGLDDDEGLVAFLIEALILEHLGLHSHEVPGVDHWHIPTDGGVRVVMIDEQDVVDQADPAPVAPGGSDLLDDIEEVLEEVDEVFAEYHRKQAGF